jgi:hypothetical protein
MEKRIVGLLVLVTTYASGFQEASNASSAPRIIINLPDSISPESVWIRYALYGPEGNGGRISRGDMAKDGSGNLEMPALFGGVLAHEAKIVVYAPGCQFGVYDFDPISGSDIKLPFHCEPLPRKTIHGFLPPTEIPSNTYLSEKKIDIAGYLDDNWACDFFLQHRLGSMVTEAGSCLGSDIPLGRIGEINPAYGGIFEMTIPDFTRDPVFGRFANQGKFGVIKLALKEKKIRHSLGTITANAAPELGLNVQTKYHDPVVFTRVH